MATEHLANLEEALEDVRTKKSGADVIMAIIKALVILYYDFAKYQDVVTDLEAPIPDALENLHNEFMDWAATEWGVHYPEFPVTYGDYNADGGLNLNDIRSFLQRLRDTINPSLQRMGQQSLSEDATATDVGTAMERLFGTYTVNEYYSISAVKDLRISDEHTLADHNLVVVYIGDAKSIAMTCRYHMEYPTGYTTGRGEDNETPVIWVSNDMPSQSAINLGMVTDIGVAHTLPVYYGSLSLDTKYRIFPNENELALTFYPNAKYLIFGFATNQAGLIPIWFNEKTSNPDGYLENGYLGSLIVKLQIEKWRKN